MLVTTMPHHGFRVPHVRSSTPRRGLVRVGLFLVVVVLVLVAGLLASGVLGLNEHEVVAGKLYRSAQPTLHELDGLIARHGIACVVSLRKDDPPAAELASEIRRLDERGLPHENVALSPTRLPKPAALARLIARFDAGPYPMLLHCEEGSDRTGLASVIWLVLYGDETLAEARASELSWRTGHIAFGQAHAMNDFFELYERTAHGLDLRQWIFDVYPGLYAGSKDRPRSGEVLAHDRG